MRTKVTNDIFAISNRIKHIDKNYYIVLDTKYPRYEVRMEGLRNSLCVVLPFPKLDKRALDYVHKTRVSNVDFDQIEEDNNALCRDFEEQQSYESQYRLRELLSVSDKGKDIDFCSGLTRWV